MASPELTTSVTAKSIVELNFQGRVYRNVHLSVMKDLCQNVILGQDFLDLHQTYNIEYGGQQPPLSICLTQSKLQASGLFSLAPNATPVATPSRRFNQTDKAFIETQVRKLLQDGIIEPSRSPWRAQVLVTTNERHKRRMVIDYSQTVNRYTVMDAYPLPRIDDLVEEVAKYKVYSTLDMKDAYHQVALQESDKTFTSFEANGQLYQFTRLPFGVTNGVSCIQRLITGLI